MAFSGDNIDRLSGANSNTGVLWSYKEAETLANVRASAYFNNSVDSGVKDGDIILLFCSDGFGMSEISVSGVTYTVAESITSA